MNNFSPSHFFLNTLIVSLLLIPYSQLKAQISELSLTQVEIPDTVVLGDTIVFSAYLKNNSDVSYINSDLSLSYYVNEIQDTAKSAVIQSELIENTINIASGDSLLIEQELIVDNVLFQIGTEQVIQKNIVIVWPTEDDYSINYHLQPLVVLKQAIPPATYNSSPNFSESDINFSNLPDNAQNLINTEYSNYAFDEGTLQNFSDGSLQFEIKLEGEDDDITLYFSEEGILVLTEVSFEESNLSLDIQNFVATNYPSYQINSAYELIFPDGTIQYMVEIKDDMDDEILLYFDAIGTNIVSPGVLLKLYEDPDIELGGIELPNTLEIGDNITVDGTLTNNLSVPYNDIPIPINYANIPFPPSISNPKLVTKTTNIDIIQPAETLSFQQNLNIDEELFYIGRNIVIVWPTEYDMNLTSNCLIHEVFVPLDRGDTVNIETTPALSNGVHITPNPTSQWLQIQTEKLLIESISIYDIAARPVEKYTAIRQYNFDVDISHLNSGMYLLYVQTNEGNAVKKLMINH